MTKISILKILLAFFAFFSVLFIVFFINYAFSDYHYGDNSIIAQNRWVINITDAMVQLPSILCIIIAMHYFLRFGYFNIKSTKFLNLSAYIMLSGIVVNLILDIALNIIPGHAAWSQLPMQLFFKLPELLISLGILTVSDFIKQGIGIQNENNLII
jgi:hypothetical protein